MIFLLTYRRVTQFIPLLGAIGAPALLTFKPTVIIKEPASANAPKEETEAMNWYTKSFSA